MNTTKYYMIECFTPFDWEDRALLGGIRLPDKFDSLTCGQKLKTPPKEPIEILMNTNHCDKLLEFDNTDGLLMTKRLYKAFIEIGVDNMDTYTTIIKHPETKFVAENYILANLIGKRSLKNLTNSNVKITENNIFDSIDKSKFESKDDESLIMFRLAESTNAVMVHEKVKNHLLNKGFNMLDFIIPNEWIG